MLNWNVYEIHSSQTIHGVKMRGRMRNFSMEKDFDLLVENAVDTTNVVRFAVLDVNNLPALEKYLSTILKDFKINLISNGMKNPVLSKLKVNTY